MALIKCQNCGREISDKAPDCIHCGALIKIELPTNTSDVLSVENKALEQQVQLQTKLSEIEKEKQRLEIEKAELENKNTELGKQLSDSKRSVETLKRKMDTQRKEERTQKVQKAKLRMSNGFKKIVQIVRFFLMSFSVFGALVALFSQKYSLAIWYGATAVALAPFVYLFAWKKIKLPTTVKVLIEILVPVLVWFAVPV